MTVLSLSRNKNYLLHSIGFLQLHMKTATLKIDVHLKVFILVLFCVSLHREQSIQECGTILVENIHLEKVIKIFRFSISIMILSKKLKQDVIFVILFSLS